jgi:hypothetical protein
MFSNALARPGKGRGQGEGRGLLAKLRAQMRARKTPHIPPNAWSTWAREGLNKGPFDTNVGIIQALLKRRVGT